MTKSKNIDNSDNSQDKTSKQADEPIPTPPPTGSHSQRRRRLLTQLAAGGGVIATGNFLPTEWKRPVIQSVLLPAHAQSSPPEEELPPGVDPDPDPSPPCGDGQGETFGSGCSGSSVVWTLGDQGDICCVELVDVECPGVCALSTRSQVVLNGTGFTDGDTVTAKWDSSNNPPDVTVGPGGGFASGEFQIDAGNLSQGCDTLVLLINGVEDCSQTFFGIPTGPCVAECD